jgi:putative ABC transport system permease protein
MDVISRRLAAEYTTADAEWSASPLPFQEEIVGNARPILMTVQAAVLLLLMIACANLANILLARGAPRAREIATRAALGASRFRIIRQLMVESLVLSILGGGAGLALAIAGIKLSRSFLADFIPRASEIHLNVEVVLPPLLASLATVFVFGLSPAVHVSRVDFAAQINAGAHGNTHNVERNKGSSSLSNSPLLRHFSSAPAYWRRASGDL